ncbi:hypothetical protein TWF281_001831 [Arthrobotrys megalospora]
MIGALSKIYETLASVIQPPKDTLGEPASMPLNGDRVDLGETARSARQVEDATKSSPVRRTARTDSYGQGIHRTGNPKGAKPIIIKGGFQPRNDLNTQRGSSAVNHQKQGHNQPIRRPGQARLHHAGQNQRNLRSSPSHASTVDFDEEADYSDDKSIHSYGLHSSKARRASHGHSMLSPQPFQRAEHSDHEVFFADESGGSVKWVGRGQKARDSMNSESLGTTTKRAAADIEPRWNTHNSSDPQPTKFIKRTRQAASSPTPIPGPGRPRKNESSKSEAWLHLKTIWRGRIRRDESTGLGGLVIRIENQGLSVVIGSHHEADLSPSYENIELAAYTDETSSAYRNFVYLKLRNRGHNLPNHILLEFRSLPEPVNPSAEPDIRRFVQWLQEQNVNTEPKKHGFMHLRMEDAKEHQFTRVSTEPSTTPWQSTVQPLPNRPIAAKPQPREVDNRPRTRSQPNPPDNLDSPWPDLQQLGVERQTRKSTRATYKKEVIEIPKPVPFPPQTWNQNLRFPFEARGSDVLDASSLRTLDNDEFLNDEVINFHLGIVKARLATEKPGLAPKVHIFNTYLYPAFSTRTERGQFNYEKVKRWTKNADLFEKDLIFIPINEKYHWLVAVVCNLPATLAVAKAREKKADVADELVAVEPTQKQKVVAKGPVPPEKCTVVILDSMGGTHIVTLKAIKTYLISEAKEKKGITLGLDDFTGLSPRKLPGQDNFSDCGVFMLHYIEKWLSDPTLIKDKLYARDFGTEEDARQLWRISEVTGKRKRMWQLYVKLNEEYEKFLRKEPFTEFPEIDDTSIPIIQDPNGDVGDAMIIDLPPSSPPVAQEITIPEAVKRQPSPAKRKSDRQEDETEHPPAKRAKSDSPVFVAEQIRPIAAPGLRPREPSVEIPLNNDFPCVLEVPETQEDDALIQRAKSLANSNIPLVAPSGLVPFPPLDNPLLATDGMFERIEEVAHYGPPPSNQPPAPSKVQTSSVNTPSIVAAATFSDLSIESSLENRARSEEDDTADVDGDITMIDTRSRRAVDEIEETEDESIDGIQYNGRQNRGKSTHELANDRIMDTPSSQDHREAPKPQNHREPKTPRKGTTVHDPICIDSQSSPKRTSPRTKTGAKAIKA